MRRFTSRSLIFRCGRYSSCHCEERTNSRDILHVFVRNATNVTRIANRKMGRHSAQKTAYFIHRSICGAGKITVYLA